MSNHDHTALPRFSRKETRQLAQEAVDAGFVYVGDDTKGHAQFYHAESGFNLSLAETPGHGQIQRVRRIIARASGKARGKFDRESQRARQAALRDVLARDKAARKALLVAAEERRAKQVWNAQVRRKVDARWRELRALDSLMRTAPGGMRPGRSIL